MRLPCSSHKIHTPRLTTTKKKKNSPWYIRKLERAYHSSFHIAFSLSLRRLSRCIYYFDFFCGEDLQFYPKLFFNFVSLLSNLTTRFHFIILRTNFRSQDSFIHSWTKCSQNDAITENAGCSFYSSIDLTQNILDSCASFESSFLLVLFVPVRK